MIKKNEELSKVYLSPHYFDKITSLARLILTEVMQFRRMMKSEHICDSAACTSCHKPHIAKITEAIMQNKKIRFVLPAFPGKSPNPAKVLGHLPDMGEKKSLVFLNDLCERIQKIYEPGAELIICSDGRVFSDVVGISENNVTAYQVEIDQFIEDADLTALSTFNLDDYVVNNDFDQAREVLIEKYGQDIDTLKERVKKGGQDSATPEEKEMTTMYCGLTRFLVEDLSFPGQTRSRSSIQKECKEKAYKAIIRSNAWTDLIAEKFPEAIRLSIHPQACGAKKIGIQLLGVEAWLTPWHAVTVNTGNGYILMKHAEVQKLNSKLILDEKGRPCHYELIEESSNRPAA